ncbi:hypothetical protein [Kitasatospora camelliae]|uniref:Lipoprotein with Yx(FWY)xxD motif n=1 Tax=Kitasatospora camelliae TaxID=3156397 RepID=A0AAU8JV60_9ACTN
MIRTRRSRGLAAVPVAAAALLLAAVSGCAAPPVPNPIPPAPESAAPPAGAAPESAPASAPESAPASATAAAPASGPADAAAGTAPDATAAAASPGAASPAPGASASAGAPDAGAVALPSGPGTTVAMTETEGLGKILVDERGRTLYLFDGDTSTKSTCYEDCTEEWIPLTTAGPPVAGQGVDDGLLGASVRTDGSYQVLYKGHPLYRYAGDAEPGDTNGRGAGYGGSDWFAVDAVGDKVRG